MLTDLVWLDAESDREVFWSFTRSDSTAGMGGPAWHPLEGGREMQLSWDGVTWWLEVDAAADASVQKSTSAG